MTKTKILLTIFLTLFAAFLTYLFLPPLTPFSPLNSSSSSPVKNPPSSNYTILGFLPYWNLKKLSPDSLSALTNFAYFSLLLDESGSLVTHNNPREEEPGYTNYKRITKCLSSFPNPCPLPFLILTFVQADQASLASLLSSPTSRQNAIKTILSLLIESQAVGVNIDFEPLGNPPPSTRQNFTLFIKELSDKLSTLPNKSLSISIYPSAASRPRLWDLAALAPSTNHFVVMTYDYTLPGDNNVGPNAPLRGAGSLFTHDILTNLAEITKLVPSQKILLGIPLYGYEWQVDDTTKYIETSGRGSVASLARIQELIATDTLELLWDRTTLTPYAIRRENGEVVSQIYYENLDSIKLKLDLVKSAGLGGIAIWALGYEGYNPSLWSLFSSLNLN
ncbi:MAG: glycoside hydrolase family 18 protein [bacterium]